MEKIHRPKRSLLGLLIAQFFGAFNDNAWKVMVFTLATRPLVSNTDTFETSSQLLATLSLVIFLAPMMLFSLPAGALADRFSKRTVIVWTKLLEVVLMSCAALSLYLAPTHLVIPFALLGMMGVQSGLFGPSKYGIMPELLPQEQLSKGNGLLEMWTMLAIIAGTGMGPILFMADQEGARPDLTWIGPLTLAILSLVGLVGSFAITRVPAASANHPSILISLKSALQSVRKDKVLWLAIWGSVCYWLTTSLLGQNVLVYAKMLVRDFERGELLQGFPPASYGLGIAFGALLSGKLSGDRIEYGFIPLGAIGFALSSLALGIIQPAMAGTVVLLILMGMSSGLLLVPLHSIVQWRAPDSQRGSIIALGNFLDIIGMILGSLVAAGMALIGFNLKMMLIASALLVLAATIWSIRVLPKALVRLCFIILTRTLYRLKTVDLQNVPKDGPGLIVANHISIIDALFIAASVKRPVRFLMNETYYHNRLLHPLAKLMDAIPVSNSSNPRTLLESLKAAGEALDNGDLVCIFPEGQISHNGRMLSFKRGIEIITKGRDCPIIPVYIANAWGSIFSFKDGRFFTKWPRPFPYALTITFGSALPGHSTVSEMRKAIQAMEHDSWMNRKDFSSPIHHTFIHNVRGAPFKRVLANTNLRIRGWQVLARAIAWARELRSVWQDQPVVGILLPTDVEGTLANLAATIAGKTTVNLPSAFLAEIIQQAKLKTILTSHAYLAEQELTLPPSVKVIYVEDLILSLTLLKKCKAVYVGILSSILYIEKYCGNTHAPNQDGLLTLLFTSGATGKPKGVVLSHFNMVSNTEAVSQILPYLGKKKNVLTALPYSHSFGYMLLWLSLNHHMTLVTHPQPRDGKGIGSLIKKYGVKLMMTTPGLLQEYVKSVIPEQFGSLKCVVAGAEKLDDQTAEEFTNRFGIRPVEGYGTTECSPVIAASTLDVRQAGIYQIGSIQGSVGQPIPGVLVKVVCPQTFEELPVDSEGLLLVKGPNIMQGYLEEKQTATTMHNGWYRTGDRAAINADGFINIFGRY